MLTTIGSFHLVKEEKKRIFLRLSVATRADTAHVAREQQSNNYTASKKTEASALIIIVCDVSGVTVESSQSLLCHRYYHSAAKSACFVCGDDWAHSNQKMTARYVKENGFHRVVVLRGTLRQYCQYYKAPSELVLVWNVQCMNKGLLIGSQLPTALLRTCFTACLQKVIILFLLIYFDVLHSYLRSDFLHSNLIFLFFFFGFGNK